jgi:hypothetical protein
MIRFSVTLEASYTEHQRGSRALIFLKQLAA